MKRFLIMLIILAVGIVAYSQNVVISNYKSFGGTTADTLAESVTKTYLLDLGYLGKWKGQSVDYTLQIWNDRVSDSLTYTTKVYESLDGTSFKATALDSASVVKSVSDHVYYKKFTNRIPRYVKVVQIATAQGQKSVVYGRINVIKHE